MTGRSAEHILHLHRSTHREIVANRNEAFLDGVCHALDMLRELDPAAADRLEARLFAKPEAPAP